MFNRLPKITAVLLASLAGLCPAAAFAYALDSEFDCKAEPHEFISDLLNKGYIESNPMRVEANSVNVPSSLRWLTHGICWRLPSAGM